MSSNQARIASWKDSQEKALAYPINRPSQMYEYDCSYNPIPQYTTTVRVVDLDTIEAGAELVSKGYRPLLLNQTDILGPGGQVEKGFRTQEASLFCRSNYVLTLLPSFYPLGDTQAVYSPGVTVFKQPTLEDIPPFCIDFVACPGVSSPVFTETGDLTQSEKEIYEKKMELILQIAAKEGHDSLVLGPFGCGAWKNPPRTVAFLFQKVLQKWEGVFREIVFACLILDKKGPSLPNVYSKQPRTNYEIFSIVFSQT